MTTSTLDDVVYCLVLPFPIAVDVEIRQLRVI